jgi:hypothetical protein
MAVRQDEDAHSTMSSEPLCLTPRPSLYRWKSVEAISRTSALQAGFIASTNRIH